MNRHPQPRRSRLPLSCRTWPWFWPWFFLCRAWCRRRKEQAPVEWRLPTTKQAKAILLARPSEPRAPELCQALSAPAHRWDVQESRANINCQKEATSVRRGARTGSRQHKEDSQELMAQG